MGGRVSKCTLEPSGDRSPLIAFFFLKYYSVLTQEDPARNHISVPFYLNMTVFRMGKLVFLGTHSPFQQQMALYKPEQYHLYQTSPGGGCNNRNLVRGLVQLNSLDATFLELNYFI